MKAAHIEIDRIFILYFREIIENLRWWLLQLKRKCYAKNSIFQTGDSIEASPLSQKKANIIFK